MYTDPCMHRLGHILDMLNPKDDSVKMALRLMEGS